MPPRIAATTPPPERQVYLDHAATTPLDTSVFEAMRPFLTENFGNPSSLHVRGRQALEAIEQARASIAGRLRATPAEIICTSGGTESNNLALRGIAMARRECGNHIITSRIEHHSVLHTCEELAKNWGFEITYLDVDETGQVVPEKVEAAITDRTVLITIMYANNEVGTVQPISRIASVARNHGVPFHSDAVQAPGALTLDVEELGVDALSLSAHKFYGPKGTGLLYLREGVPIVPVQSGGPQERGRRAGTESTAGIVGMAHALQIAEEAREAESTRQASLRERLLREFPRSVSGVQVTGHPHERLPNHASFVIDGVDGDNVVLGLDSVGIAASTGAACSTGLRGHSHVLLAMGHPGSRARGALRLTVGRDTNDHDVDYVLNVLPHIVEATRRIHRFDSLE